MTTGIAEHEAHRAAEAAWANYRDVEMRHHPRRQLRKRDFIAGYMHGRRDEAQP